VGLASSLARDRRIALLGSGSPMKSGPSPAMPAILAVEPDPEVVEALRLDLPQAGYAPLVARTGEAALALMQRTPPDLLLFDLSLGSSGGEELWARLRVPAYRAIPAILIAFTVDPMTALYVLLLYVGVQQLEGYVLMPLVQRWAVELPPALGVLSVVVLGVLFGVPGALFAVPLTIVAIVLVRELYLD